MRVDKIAKALNITLEGDESLEITKVSPPSFSAMNSITFIEKPYREKESLKKGGAFLLSETDRNAIPIEDGKAYVFSSAPRLSFAVLLDLFNPYKHLIPELDAISAGAKIHPSVVIAPNCIIGSGAVLEKGVKLKGNNYVGPGAIIKSDTVIDAGAVVLAGCEVGASCYLGPNVSIGADGFGYEKTEKGLIKIPHIGRVVLEDQVEVGANSCIDRATLGETRIGFNTKIDNLVQIGHNVQVGAHCVIVAQVGIAGSSRIGEGSVLAGQVGICDHSYVGEGSIIGAKGGTFPNQSLPPNSKVAGFPSIPLMQYLKINSALKYLPKLIKKSKDSF